MLTHRTAALLARSAHQGQLYDGRPYAETHLPAVVQVLTDFGFTASHMQAAGWLHDTLEDTDLTPADIRGVEPKALPLVWAVTGHGKSRKARNADIYRKIVAVGREAAVLKLADRIANAEASRASPKHRATYQKELPEFEAVIRDRVPSRMWDRLVRALSD